MVERITAHPLPKTSSKNKSISLKGIARVIENNYVVVLPPYKFGQKVVMAKGQKVVSENGQKVVMTYKVSL